jgi:hypothetical protein
MLSSSKRAVDSTAYCMAGSADKVKLIVNYGGELRRCPVSGMLRYIGGENLLVGIGLSERHTPTSASVTRPSRKDWTSSTTWSPTATSGGSSRCCTTALPAWPSTTTAAAWAPSSSQPEMATRPRRSRACGRARPHRRCATRSQSWTRVLCRQRRRRRSDLLILVPIMPTAGERRRYRGRRVRDQLCSIMRPRR